MKTCPFCLDDNNWIKILPVQELPVAYWLVVKLAVDHTTVLLFKNCLNEDYREGKKVNVILLLLCFRKKEHTRTNEKNKLTNSPQYPHLRGQCARAQGSYGPKHALSSYQSHVSSVSWQSPTMKTIKYFLSN